VEGGYTNNQAIFVTPVPTIAALGAQKAAVLKAQALTATRVHGAASARDAQVRLLLGLLENGAGYVQGIADNAPTYEQAVSIIEASGFTVVKPAIHTKELLSVTQAVPGGPVVLDANVGTLTNRSAKHRCFGWQYTPDGGKTFVTLPSTPTGKTIVTGLTALTTYGFRVNVTFSNGAPGAWSQIVAFLVR
jgi:hypothetical protein